LLLGNGSRFGISITYIEQRKPLGIVDGIRSSLEFLDGETSAVHLADNFFFGSGFPNLISANEPTISEARVFTYKVNKPRAFGILEEDNGKIISLEEKPETPKGDQAITGLYLFDGSLKKKIAKVGFSQRGEMEIIDLLRLYKSDDALQFTKLPRGSAWLDLGTTEDLYRASNFVEILQSRQGVLVGSPEEIAVSKGWLSKSKLTNNLQTAGRSMYLDLLTESLGNQA
jgi:glucose-1-phosphate thymidylyltransferase